MCEYNIKLFATVTLWPIITIFPCTLICLHLCIPGQLTIEGQALILTSLW